MNWSVAFFSVGALLALNLYGQEKHAGVRVHVLAFGSFGEVLTAAKVTIMTVTNKPVASASGHSVVFPQLAPGTYVVRVVCPGFRTQTAKLTANTADVLLRIGLSLRQGDEVEPAGDNLTISGSVEVATGSNWWITVHGVFLRSMREALIGDGGRFSIGGLDMGTYLVEVFEGGTLKYTRTVQIDTKDPVTMLQFSK
jgi:hypothetical protein